MLRDARRNIKEGQISCILIKASNFPARTEIQLVESTNLRYWSSSNRILHITAVADAFCAMLKTRTSSSFNLMLKETIFCSSKISSFLLHTGQRSLHPRGHLLRLRGRPPDHLPLRPHRRPPLIVDLGWVGLS